MNDARRKVAIVAICGLHIIVGIVLATGWLKEPWHSSPAELRNKRDPDKPLMAKYPDLGADVIFPFEFQPRDFGATHRGNTITDVLNPKAPLPKIELRLEGENVHLDWGPTPDLAKAEAVARNHFGDVSAYVEETEVRLPNDDGWILPAAQGTAYRTGKNSWAGLEENQKNVALRPANPTFRVEEIPAELRLWKAPRSHHGPVHRVVFKTNGLARGCWDGADLYGARTGASLADYPREVGDFKDWLALDFPLKTWHETPVVVSLDVFFGDPVPATLPLRPNSSVIVANRIRVGHVFTGRCRFRETDDDDPSSRAGEWSSQLVEGT